MDIFLLGNGFDLHHNFPTNYYDFLQTIQFLIDNRESSFDTVASVFGDEKLQTNDENILRAYEKHQYIYSQVALDRQTLFNITSIAKNNIWFKYLSNCVNKELGWIDFEKEIITVIDAFEIFINDEKNDIYISDDSLCFNIGSFPRETAVKFIIRQFAFFFDSVRTPHMRFDRIKDKYIIESPKGSGAYLLRAEEIVGDLYKSLRELADLLKEYLYYFVDCPSNKMKEKGIVPQCTSYPAAAHVFTFNYTNTYEYFHGEASILHLHGSTESEIVLGINPDERDEIRDVDTLFLQFKKYYQRIFFRTDLVYLNKIKALSRTRKTAEGITLHVIGHSLDITDEDVIKQLFSLSHRIRILYHSEEKVGTYIKNLVNIYGKRDFDILRDEKDLQFLPQMKMEWKSS